MELEALQRLLADVVAASARGPLELLAAYQGLADSCSRWGCGHVVGPGELGRLCSACRVGPRERGSPNNHVGVASSNTSWR